MRNDTDLAATATAAPSTDGGGVVVVGAAHLTTVDASPGRPLPGPDLPERCRQRYQITGEHGRGGLGLVLRAVDRELGRAVALKELQQRGRDADARFVREATITARLQHPSIVRVYEAGRWPDGRPFYAMELVAGRPLHALIAEASTLPMRLALVPHAVAVADAMAYAHARRIIHRDLKPSNVMVGEFGETVVIDWGLAKDLSEPVSSDERADGPAPVGAGVTSAGAVLGTPAFMSPEQSLGHASEASDIYSIGALLHHVVAGQPPATAGRAPLPRRTPPDLAAIIARALAVDARDRYASARDLADDLRRYLRREPVTARRYGPLGRLALAAARNRRVAAIAALSLTAITALSLAAVVLVDRQRARAVSAEGAARTAQHRAEETVGELTLANARLLLASDPSRAVDVLDAHRGVDPVSADLVRAEAIALGVAAHRLQPHSDGVTLLAATRRGHLLSAGEDATIAVTSVATGVSTPIASDMASSVAPAHAADRVAYVSASSSLLVAALDGARHQVALPPSQPRRLALSPAGDVAAVLLQDGTIGAWRVDRDAAVSILDQVPGAIEVFALADRVIAVSPRQIAILPLGGSAASRVDLPAAATALAIDPDGQRLGVGFADGSVQRWRLDDLTSTPPRAACQAAVAAVSVAAARWLAYACVDHAGGAADLEHGEDVALRLEAAGTRVAIDGAGRLLMIGSARGVVSIKDLVTGFSQELRGHRAQINRLRAPSPELPFLVTADDKGEVRLWPVPTPPAQLASVASRARYIAAIGGEHADRLIAVGTAGTALLWDLPSGACRPLPGHRDLVVRARISPDQRRAVTGGQDGTARLWDLASGTAVGAVGDVAIADVEFLDDDTLVIGGADGSVVAWSPRLGSHRRLHRAALPVQGIEPLPAIDAVAAAFSDGSVVLLERDGRVRAVPDALGVPRSFFRASPDGRVLALGSTRGEVTLYDPRTGALTLAHRLSQPVRHMAFDDRGRHLAIAGEGGELAVLDLGSRPSVVLAIHEAQTRFVAVSHDGRAVAAAGSDGATRLYDVVEERWTVLRLHDAAIASVQFSADDRTLAVLGVDGRIALVDVAATLHRAGTSAVPARAPFSACKELIR